MIRLCPSDALLEMWKQIPKHFIVEEVQDKPTCPLCLLAVTQLYAAIKANKTEVLICC